MAMQLGRREALGILAAVPLLRQLPAAEPGAPLFFTKEQFALVDHLTDLIIPTDSHSPGAKATQAASYIDRTIAESIDPADKQAWRTGLSSLDTMSQQMNQTPFNKASAEQQIATLKKIAVNEKDPKTDAEKFFRTLKTATVFAYYTSRIGIHDDMQYKGNVILQQYVGYEAE